MLLLVMLWTGVLMVSTSTALAECKWASRSGDNEVVICQGSPQTSTLSMSAGNDKVTIRSDGEVNTAGYAIHTGGGNDEIFNNGLIKSKQNSVDMSTGTDWMENRGTIRGGDDGLRCAPRTGETCTLRNLGWDAWVTGINEALEINSTGGRTVIHNEGRISSTSQEGVHLHGLGTYEVTNLGEIRGWRTAVESYQGDVVLTNYGTIYSWRLMAVELHDGNDIVINYGEFTTGGWQPAINTWLGNDRVENYGIMVSRNDEAADSTIETSYGDDVIVNSGTVRETRDGYAAIEAGSGSDTVIIQGGLIEGLIAGDSDEGGSGFDTLIFQIQGTQSEIDQFRAQISGKSPGSGSITWKGNTYRWAGFEQILQDVTVTK